MVLGHRPAALLAALLVAVSFAAAAPGVWAQSAGDEQYEDPFGDEGGGGGSAGGSGSAGGGATGGSGSAGGGAAGGSGSGGGGAAGGSAPAGASASAGDARLPRTGRDPLAEALAGLGLVLAGIGLRLRLRPDGRPD